MSSQFEIEIKSLLGEKENADNLRDKLLAKGATLKSQHKQLNHYFVINDLEKFKNGLEPHVSELQKDYFKKILTDGKDFSIRTRDADGKVILVIKASIDEGTSSNAVSRMEFEDEVGMTLDDLDKLLLENGLEYQAKWSREREEYKLNDEVNVTIDKNAGYGYLAEFETVVDSDETVEEEKKMLNDLMNEFGVVELMQDRLERMFDFYNKNWRDYYGTDKVFNIE